MSKKMTEMDKSTDILKAKKRCGFNFLGTGLQLTRRRVLAAMAGALLFPRVLYAAPERSRVVVVYGGKPAAGDSPAAAAKAALDLGVSRLFGKGSATAWTDILARGGPVSIKVDTRSPLATTGDALVLGLLQNLFDNLVQPWNITIWDKRASDTARRGFRLETRRGELSVHATEKSNTVSDISSGYASEFSYVPSWAEEAGASRFSSLLNPPPPTLFNLPALKHHPLLGIDCALAGPALGAVDNTTRFYASADDLANAVAGIWSLPPLGGHVLTVVDAEKVVFNGGPVGLPAWTASEGALIIGTDPVAVDAVALKMIDKHRKAVGLASCLEQGVAFLTAAEQAGLGRTGAEEVIVQV